jgi:hypothetical protein
MLRIVSIFGIEKDGLATEWADSVIDRVKMAFFEL